MSSSYSEVLLDHHLHPRNEGPPEPGDLVGAAHYMQCGDVLVLALRVVDGIITRCRFRSTGCGCVTACGSMTTVMITGRTVKDALEITAEQLAEAVGGLSVSKFHAAILPVRALAIALREDVAEIKQDGGEAP